MASRFVTNLSEIRRRARQHVLEGAVTAGYEADREKVLALLNEALATELVCVLRYKQHYFLARGIQAEPVAQEFAEHAAEEQQHVDMVATRITQLNGAPNFDPKGLATRSHGEYGSALELEDMIREDLVAERVAIETYSTIVRWLGDRDPTTRTMMEGILKTEEEHADDLANLLARK